MCRVRGARFAEAPQHVSTGQCQYWSCKCQLSGGGSGDHTFSIWRSLTSCQNCVYVRRFIRSGRQVVCGACSTGMSHFAGSDTVDLRTSILRPFLFVAVRSASLRSAAIQCRHREQSSALYDAESAAQRRPLRTALVPQARDTALSALAGAGAHRAACASATQVCRFAPPRA